MECLSYCLANSIDLTQLDNYFKSTAGGLTTKSRDVLKILPINPTNSVIFAFKNGTVVTWGIKRYQVNFYLNKNSL